MHVACGNSLQAACEVWEFCAQLELQLHDTLAKHWRHLAKKEAKAVKDAIAGHVPVAQRPEATFLPALLADFLQVIATCATKVSAV